MKNTSASTEIKFKKISIVEEKQTQQETQLASEPNKPEKTPTKPIRLDPTRYGDWEKNGRCIDF